MGLPVDARTAAVGFAGALVVLAALAWIVGVGDVIDALGTARPPLVAGVVAAAAAWVVAWAMALRAVLGALSARLSISRAVPVYAGALFANNVTPFGQAGGEPASALLVSEAAGTEYETALAAIASADSVNLVPSTAFAVAGVAYLSLSATREGLLWPAAAAVGLAVVLPVVGFLAWRDRDRIEAAVTRAATPLARAVGDRLPRLEAPTRGAVAARVDGFFRSIEAVAGDRRALAAAVGLSALGWFAQVVALWLSLQAVGVAAPFAAAFVAVPVGAVAGVTPLPGGLGGIEAVLVAVLVPLAGASPAVAAAAVAIHRGAIYWLPTLVGGGVVSALGAERIAS